MGSRLRTAVMAVALALVVSTACAGDWVDLRQIPTIDERYIVPHGGSAMCYGQDAGDGHIWLLYGKLGEQNAHGYFARYDVSLDSWTLLPRMPQDTQSGWGGALAYVPRPGLYPPSGWVFAFKGGWTSEFWLYSPSMGQWYRGPSLVDSLSAEVPVDSGGALCYGGGTAINGMPHAVLYALSGHNATNPSGPGRFFRYVFSVAPSTGPLSGSWQELVSVPPPVSAGGALTWCRSPAEPESEGQVFALTGYDSHLLYKYIPEGAIWLYEQISLPVGANRGGSLCVGPDGGTIYGLYGKFGVQGAHEWFFYDPDTRILHAYVGDEATESEQAGGAAICFDGDRYVYVECGNYPYFRRFEPDAPDSSGGQGSAGRSAFAPKMQQTVSAGQHRFRVSGIAPGPVLMRIFDASGRSVARLGGVAANSHAELVWNHGTSAQGTYIFSFHAAGATLRGTLILVD